MRARRSAVIASLAAALGSAGSAVALTPAIRCDARTACPPGLTCKPIPDRPGEPGICHPPAPTSCPKIRRPVCGMDFRTYANECEMRRNEIGLQHRGPC